MEYSHQKKIQAWIAMFYGSLGFRKLRGRHCLCDFLGLLHLPQMERLSYGESFIRAAFIKLHLSVTVNINRIETWMHKYSHSKPTASDCPGNTSNHFLKQKIIMSLLGSNLRLVTVLKKNPDQKDIANRDFSLHRQFN